MANDRNSNDFMSFNPFSDARMTFFAPNSSFQRQKSNYFPKIRNVMYFYALQVSFEQIYYALAQKPDKLIWTRLKETISALARKQLEQLKSVGILCDDHPKTSNTKIVVGR